MEGSNSGSSYYLSWWHDNVDEYEFPLSGPAALTLAADLSRNRLEPTYQVAPPAVPAWTYLNPITEFGFDYGLIDSLPLWIGNPIFDRFGHAIQEDDDWYAIKIPSWQPQTVRVGDNNRPSLKREYPVRLMLEIEFDMAEGDMALDIYDGYSIDPLTFDPEDFVSFPKPIASSDRSTLEDGTESVVARIDVTSEDLIYYVNVRGQDLGNDYSLKWSVTEEDAYEGEDTNNFVELAYDLTSANGASTELIPLHQIEYPVDVNGDGDFDNDGGFTAPRGYGSQTTDDWYTIVVSPGSTELEVHCDFFSDDSTGYVFGPDNLDMDVEVYFLEGSDYDPLTEDLRKPVLVNRIATTTDPFPDNPPIVDADTTELRHEFDTFAIVEPGIYFVRVFFDNRTHPYTFYWDDKGDGDGNNVGDQAIIDDYLDDNWSFVAPEDLPINLLENPYENTDGDRWPNWAEFALLLDASKWDYVIIGKSIVEDGGEEYFQFQYLRSREAVALGYQFTVEETEDLNFDGTPADYIGTEILGSEVERVTYRCTQPMSVQDKCFFRLAVEEPTP